MGKNQNNSFKPSMRKVKEALMIKAAHRKAYNEGTSAARAAQRARENDRSAG